MVTPRLDQMSMRELEDAGQRWYAAKGRAAGEDADDADEWVADPDDDVETYPGAAA